MKKIAGHTIQFGRKGDGVSLECTCGCILSVVPAVVERPTEAAYRLGRPNLEQHLEDPTRWIETTVAA